MALFMRVPILHFFYKFITAARNHVPLLFSNSNSNLCIGQE